MAGEPDIEAVNLRRRLALLTNGEVRPITNLFAAGGLETDDPSAAVSCVVKDSETHWFAVDLASYQPAILQ